MAGRATASTSWSTRLNGQRTVTLRQIALTCRDGDKVVAAISFALQDPIGFEQLIAAIEAKPKAPAGGEWLETFKTYTTDLPEDAKPLPAEMDVAYPGRHQSRTVVQTTLTVQRADAAAAELADYRSYDFLVTGEVLEKGELFGSFRYKFDLPAPDVTGERIPLVFERYLRPGDYTLVVKLEDMNGQRFFREERALTVPQVGTAAPPPPPADAETARLLAEANAAIANGETTIKFVPPRQDLLTGFVRFETLTTGEAFDQGGLHPRRQDRPHQALAAVERRPRPRRPAAHPHPARPRLRRRRRPRRPATSC